MAGWHEVRGAKRARFVAGVALLSLLITGGVVGSAHAEDDYPTFAEVQAVRANAVAKEAMIKRIEGVIDDLDKKAQDAQDEAQKYGDIYQAADQAVQEQAVKANALQTQADNASAEAKAAKQQAAQLLIQQYRSSGNDVSLDVFLNADPDDLLYDMSMTANVVGQSQNVFDNAVQLQNTAQSLSDQAVAAQTELEQLRKKAEVAFDKASTAAEKAQAALDTQIAKKAEQEQLLAELKSVQKSTEADYEKGVAARAAAANAARGGVYSGPPRIVGGSWAYPSGGRITSPFGYRLNPWGGSGKTFHLGTDLGAGCGGWIYAAHSGTVSYSGWNGVYGNFIRIDHGDGLQTEYGHIQNGGLLVGAGETVTVGDHIANAGDTGGATGCHLHFGVRVDGLVTDPVPYMAANGVNLGQ